MRRLLSFVSVFVAFAAFSAVPVRADDVSECRDVNKPPAVAACTRAISSGRWTGKDVAWAYFNRALAQQAQGNFDRSIADYDQVLRLDSSYKYAHYGRALVHKAKGDKDHNV